MASHPEKRKLSKSHTSSSKRQKISENLQEQIEFVKATVRSRLGPEELPSNQKSKSLESDGLESQRKSLHDLLERAIVAHENTAALLMGYRGSGKTKVLNFVLKQLADHHGRNAFTKVYLNGFIQTDDTMAMKTICRAINIDFDEKCTDEIRKNSFSDNLVYLREVLLKAKEVGKPIFFILDEFDLFANRAKQTLLYNLFDMLQSNTAQIAVIGVTTRQDVFELLEKRIRSRFSHRRILFTNDMDLPTLKKIMINRMSIPEDKCSHPYCKDYNKDVTTTFKDKSVNRQLKRNFDQGKSVAWFLNLCKVAISRLSLDNCSLLPADLLSAFLTFTSDYKKFAVRDCSIMELVLLVAMANLEYKRIAPYNFAQVFHEYEQCHRHNADLKIHIYSRPVARKAFERLEEACLISKAGSTQKDVSMFAAKEFQLYQLSLDPDIFTKMIKKEMKNEVPLWFHEWITAR